MNRNFTRILVPTDFSAPSNAALALAKRMATMSGASLHLIHVLEDPFAAVAYATDVYAPPPAGIRESWLKGAQGLLDTQLTPDEQLFFRSTQVVVLGTPARDIVHHAAANDIDLIVMGTHGRGGVHHLLMEGSPSAWARGTVPGAHGEGHREVRCEPRERRDRRRVNAFARLWSLLGRIPAVFARLSAN